MTAWRFGPTAKRSIREALARDGARLNIWHGAVRSGKTVASLIAWFTWVAKYAPAGDLVMVGKTERTLERNILRPLEAMVGPAFTYNRGTGEGTLYGRRVYFYGANDERAEGKIRGATVAGAYGDELTLWPSGFYKQLLARMSVPGARLFGTTNPDSPYHWLRAEYLERRGELNLADWQFALDDNVALDPEYVRDLRAFYGEGTLWYRRFIEGQWVVAEGAVYDAFDTTRHLISERPVPAPDLWLLGMDYGASNPTAGILLGIMRSPIRDGPHKGLRAWVERELYLDSAAQGRTVTERQAGDALEAWLARDVLEEGYLDPAAPGMLAELHSRSHRRRDLANIMPADNSVLDGIQTVATMLAGGELRIRADLAPQLVRDFGAYLWDAKAQARGEDKPLKQHDHTLDALRYALHTHYGSDRTAPRARAL